MVTRIVILCGFDIESLSYTDFPRIVPDLMLIFVILDATNMLLVSLILSCRLFIVLPPECFPRRVHAQLEKYA